MRRKGYSTQALEAQLDAAFARANEQIFALNTQSEEAGRQAARSAASARAAAAFANAQLQ